MPCEDALLTNRCDKGKQVHGLGEDFKTPGRHVLIMAIITISQTTGNVEFH